MLKQSRVLASASLLTFPELLSLVRSSLTPSQQTPSFRYYIFHSRQRSQLGWRLNLTQDASLKIWERSLSRLRDSGLQLEFSEDEILEFGNRHWLDNEDKTSRHWNGRQIKSAFQAALALVSLVSHASQVSQAYLTLTLLTTLILRIMEG